MHYISEFRISSKVIPQITDVIYGISILPKNKRKRYLITHTFTINKLIPPFVKNLYALIIMQITDNYSTFQQSKMFWETHVMIRFHLLM